MKKFHYILLEEHKRKVESSNLDHQTCYEMLNLFIPSSRDSDSVPVHSKNLEIITYKYKDYLTFFIQNKLIYINNYYSVPNKVCREYKLREEKPSPLLLEPITALKFINNRTCSKTKRRNQMRLLTKQETFKLMKRTYIEFMDGIDTNAILAQVNTEESVGHRLRLAKEVFSIRNKNYYFKRNTTNQRLDSNLTNLRREYKFYHKRSDLSVIDIKNSQPFLLYILLKNSQRNAMHLDRDIDNVNIDINNINHGDEDLPIYIYYHNLRESGLNSYDTQNFKCGNFVDSKELELYGRLVKTGAFYDHLKESFKTDREGVKDIMMKVLYSKNNHYGDLKAIFRKEFSTIDGFIREFKDRYGYETFAIHLQTIESTCVLDVICRVMAARGIVPVTIHDSWIVPTKREEESISIIKECFGQDSPTFSVERFVDKQRKIKIS